MPKHIQAKCHRTCGSGRIKLGKNTTPMNEGVLHSCRVGKSARDLAAVVDGKSSSGRATGKVQSREHASTFQKSMPMPGGIGERSNDLVGIVNTERSC